MPRGIPNRKTAAEDPAGAGVEPDSAVDDAIEEPLSTAASESDPTPDPSPTPDPEAPVDEQQPCPVCFPDGWPAGATSVGCVHGQWDRATAGE